MTIINAFDDSSKAIVTPQRNISSITDFPQTVIATFRSKFQNLVMSRFVTEQILDELPVPFTGTKTWTPDGLCATMQKTAGAQAVRW
ncbi:MAG: hypothetical protein LKF99_04995 [Bifidobacterium sp.]|jgi:hypothetical protein|nr:hypothetical protein [Bifidobacterium sp.]